MKAKKFPYTYFAYGLTIGSHFPIFGFSEAISENPDIVIEKGETPERLLVVRNQSKYYQSNGEEYLLHVKGIADYYITAGNTVIIQPEANANMDLISIYLGGMVLGALFHQRGLMPLHASSVVYNEKCLIFAGNAGSGKSTLAAMLVNSGAKLIADDISVIDFSDNYPVVYPGYPFMKVWKHDFTKLGIIDEVMQKVPFEIDKYYWPVSEFIESKMRINTIFILEPSEKDNSVTFTLQGVQKFQRLKNCGYMANSLNNTYREKLHFEMINSLAEKIPVILISRPERGFSVDLLESVILDHLNK